jgi:hypothetical protein
MEIRNLTENELPNGTVELSADIGGFNLHFRFPTELRGGSHIGDCFAAAALIPSMKEGTPLELRGYPISAKLAANMQTIQEVFHCWNPEALRIVEVRVEREAPRTPHERTGSMFSGGVDSMHTFLKRKDEVTDLILIDGFDFMLTPEELEESLRRNREFAARFGKRLIPVQTNFLEFERKMGLSRHLGYGLCLASVILSIGLRRVFVPSSHTYADLVPSSSHPLTDPMWSNGGVEVIHSNADAVRARKVEEIAQHPEFLQALRVCWNQHNGNCGKCAKCVRTMLTLKILGVPGPFPPRVDPRIVRTLRPASEIGLNFILDNLVLAAQHGDQEVFKALKRAVRRWDRRWAVHYFDRGFLNNLGRRIWRKLRPPVIAPLAFGNRRPDLDL